MGRNEISKKEYDRRRDAVKDALSDHNYTNAFIHDVTDLSTAQITRALKELGYESIKDARSQHLTKLYQDGNTIEDIEKITWLSEKVICTAVEEELLTNPLSPDGTISVVGAIELGAGSYSIIKEITDEPLPRIQRIVKKKGFKSNTQLQLHTAKKYMNGGGRSLERLCKDLGLTPSSFYHKVKRMGLEKKWGFKYSSFSPFGVNPPADKRINEGADVFEILEYMDGDSNQAADYYMNATAQHESWKSARQEKRDKEREDVFTKIEGLKTYITQASRNDLPLQRTISYIRGRSYISSNAKCAQKVYAAFQKIEEAEQAGLKPKLHTISNDVGATHGLITRAIRYADAYEKNKKKR